MRNRLSLDESRLFPVQAFFNGISDRNFQEIISYLTRGVGHGLDYAICTFPNDLDPGDEPYEGVTFSLFEDEVVISEDEFQQYLRGACQSFVADHPDQAEAINELLQRFDKQ